MGNSDSSDDGHSATKLVKLNRGNWSIWKSRFRTIIYAKGYEDLMDAKWTNANKETKEFRKMCAWGINKLYTTVEEDLHPIIISNEDNLFDALNALSSACGEKSVVMICDKLYHLINLTYEPGTSLAQHISSFRRHYTALITSLNAKKEFMSVSTGMAAALLLRSLHQDESLSALVQNMYDLEPLTFEKVFDRLSAEDGRKETSIAESAYSLNQSNRRVKQKLHGLHTLALIGVPVVLVVVETKCCVVQCAG
jgi:hypothetical protein